MNQLEVNEQDRLDYEKNFRLNLEKEVNDVWNMQ